MTDLDWERGKVDQRCRDCGATSAGSSWCFACGGRNVEHRTHAETPVGDILWCSGRPKTAGAAHPGQPEAPFSSEMG